MSVNYGSKRTVVGAHYGIRDWLVQRITAALIVLFTLALIGQIIFSSGPVDYTLWHGIFSQQWMKLLTFVIVVAVLWHAWVGVRDIWMDYVQPVGLKLALDVFTLVWLIACAGWAFQVLWNI